MTNKSKSLAGIVVGCCAGLSAVAADRSNDQLTPKLQAGKPSDASPWHIGVGGEAGFNMSVRIRTLQPAPADPAAGANVNRAYDDGYVNVDSSGNAGGKTWFWGYQNAAQYDPSGAGSITMHHLSGPAKNGIEQGSDEPRPGFELTLARDIWEIGRMRVGLEAGVNYVHFGQSDSVSGASTYNVTADTFSMDGAVPPAAPYSGTFLGPGTLITATPSGRILSSEMGTFNQSYDVDANLAGFRLGPYISLPLRKIALQFGAGVTVVWANGQFEVTETVTTPSTSATRSSSSRTSDFLIGPHAGLRLSVPVNDRFAIFAGGRYAHLGRWEQKENGLRTELDFSNSIFLQAGLDFSF